MIDFRPPSSGAGSVLSRRSGATSCGRSMPRSPFSSVSEGTDKLGRSASVPRIFATPHWQGPDAALSAASGIPGYTGFVPGICCENVLGVSHSRARTLAQEARVHPSLLRRSADQNFAVLQRSLRQARESKNKALANDDARFPKDLLTVAGTRRGAEVPGYTGFIPNKSVGGVIGLTFADSNSAAMHVRQDPVGGLALQSMKTPSEATG